MSDLKVKSTEEKKTTIEVVEHLAFEGDMKTNIVSSMDIYNFIEHMTYFEIFKP